MEAQKLELTLSANMEFSSLLRHVSEEVFQYVGFTTEWSNRLKLVVDELFMNANRYGSKADSGKIYANFLFENGQVVFQIEDEGLGEKKVTAQELRTLLDKNTHEVADLTKTRGRGLALISALWTDELKIEDSLRGGLLIRFKKSVSHVAPPAPPKLQVVDPMAEKQVPEQVGAVSPLVHSGPRKIIALEGEIDADNIAEKIKPILSELVLMTNDSVLVLDCEKLTYINSTFIGHLAGWHNELSKKNGHLVLQHLSKDVKDILDLVGLGKVIYMEA